MPVEKRLCTSRRDTLTKHTEAIHEAFGRQHGIRAQDPASSPRRSSEHNGQDNIDEKPDGSGEVNNNEQLKPADYQPLDATALVDDSTRRPGLHQKLIRRLPSLRQPVPQPPIYRLLPSLFGASTGITAGESTSSSTSTTATPTRRQSVPGTSDFAAPFCDLPLSVQLSGHNDGDNFDLGSPKAFLFSSPTLHDDSSSCVSRAGSFVPSQLSSMADASNNGNVDHSSVLRRRAHRVIVSAVEYDALEQSYFETCDVVDVSRSMSEVLLRKPSINAWKYGDEYSAYQSRRIAVRSNSDPGGQRLSRVSVLPHNVPSEVLVSIFVLLSPSDFNNARHVCRKWMAASVDRTLLYTMLHRGGWSSGVHLSSSSVVSIENTRSLLPSQDAWSLSCVLARECALRADWGGNCLPSSSKDASSPRAFLETGHIDFEDLASGFAGKGILQSSGLVFTVSVCGEFLMVGEGGMIYVYALEGNTLRPLTSVICPRRVLAMSMDATSHRFTIAALLDGRMGIMCELHIGRDKHGRTCRLAEESTAADQESSQRSAQNQYSVFSSQPSQTGRSAAIAQQINGGSVQTFETDALENSNNLGSSSTFDAIDVQSNSDHYELDHTDRPDHLERNWINQEWNFHLRSTRMEAVSCEKSQGTRRKNDLRSDIDDQRDIPVETGNRSIYRHLCSEDDPPRSVAICPQRRCVAFGCSAGIELHWIDALTGQDLNRWFPLTAPSDVLYFLPPRAGLDTAKKLRLISSAAHPLERPALCRKFNAGHTWLTSFWGPLGLNQDGQAQAAVSISDCDHYRAVPLSDGFHVLFTDPRTNFLCLGTDAPLGGPIKLLRKWIFVPPTERLDPQPHDESCYLDSPQQQLSAIRPLIPRLYAATSDPRSGPRVVCVYGDEIMLYAVPPDAYEYSRAEQIAVDRPVSEATGSVALSEPSDQILPEWLRWWPSETTESTCTSDPPTPPGSATDSVWPVYVRGIRIGCLEGLVDIAINEVPGGDLSIWAFGLDGHATVWQLDTGRYQDGLVRKTVIGQDAKTAHCFYADENGDAVMDDADALYNNHTNPMGSTEGDISASNLPTVSSLDGNSSCFGSPHRRTTPEQQRANNPFVRCLTHALHIDNDSELENISAPTGEVMYDEEGNIYIFEPPLDPLNSDNWGNFEFLDVLST